MPPGDPTAGMSIDLNQYNDLVDKGAIALQRLGPQTFQMIMKRYDPANGQELPPGVMPVNKDGVDGSIKQVEAQIAVLEKSKASLEKLSTDMAQMEADNVSLLNTAQAASPPTA